MCDGTVGNVIVFLFVHKPTEGTGLEERKKIISCLNKTPTFAVAFVLQVLL
jgi:hypothetical protein